MELLFDSQRRRPHQTSSYYQEKLMVRSCLNDLYSDSGKNYILWKVNVCVCITSSGSKSSLKSVAMITISESDNWEINSSSGMKYGQFVDWEKIDPEAASKYQQILKSGQHQLKTMGRTGFWAMPHTLRAKAYYHIIHGINSRLALSMHKKRDVFAKKIMFK